MHVSNVKIDNMSRERERGRERVRERKRERERFRKKGFFLTSVFFVIN